MNSATSKTEGDPSPFAIWQIYALLGMLAAAAAVWVSRNTHPVALVLLSAAAIGAGIIAYAVHQATASFFSPSDEVKPIDERQRAVLEREKALVMRSIKELEFDRAMGKIGDADFAAMSSRLRARALTLMQDLELVAPEAPAAQPESAGKRASGRAGSEHACGRCGTANDADAKFCKQCGTGMERA